MSECALCKAKSELSQVDSPAIRLCSACREKLKTHIAAVCTGCDTVYWVKKSPANVMFLAELEHAPPQYIADNLILHEIKKCRGCYKAVEQFTQTAAWVQ